MVFINETKGGKSKQQYDVVNDVQCSNSTPRLTFDGVYLK